MMRAAVAVLLCCATAARAETLVAGEPPLTDDVVDRTCNFLEWGLDLQMTSAQRDDARQLLVKAWKHKDRAAIESIGKLLTAQEQLAKASADARAQAQRKFSTDLVAAMRKDTKDPTSKWLLSVYDAAHKPLVAGEPALTRQMVDAYAELLGFVVGQATKGAAIVPGRKDKDAIAKHLIAGWSKADAAQQQQIAQIPAMWAAMRVQWATTSDVDRKQLREQWAQALAPPSQAKTHKSSESAMAQMMAETARHQAMMNVITAMGCGLGCSLKYEYRWNP